MNGKMEMMKVEDNQKHTMQTELKIHYDDQFLEDIIITALEGGSNYWIVSIKGISDKPQKIPISVWVFNQLKDGNTITLYPVDGDLGFLTMRKLHMGVRRYFSDSKNLIGGLTLDAADYDANMADKVLQYAVFGKLVYG